MSGDELAYMTDNNDFDLPRWQTHDNIQPQQSHSSYGLYSPTVPPPSLTAGRLPPMQSSPSQTRQPRINQLLDQEQQHSSSYLAPNQPQLSRSTSLGASSAYSSRTRRAHQPDDLEGNFGHDNSSYSTPVRQHPPPGNSFYSPAVSHQTPPIASNSQSSQLTQSASSAADSYLDSYYTPNSGANGPKRSLTTYDPSSSSAKGKLSPRPGNMQPPSDAMANHSPYSPPNTSYSFHSPDQRSYSHSRVQSQGKPEPSSPYTSHTPMNAPGYSSPYAMDTTSPQPPSQAHLNSHLSSRQPTSISNPNTPLSYLHPSQSHSGHFYSHDPAMAVDPSPPPKRRLTGFRRVHHAHELQPRTDVPPTARRMDASGAYLSPLKQLTTGILETYRICNPQFRYESAHNPRRVLTKPSKPAHNDGYDNDDYDYILYVNDWLGGDDGHKYLILDILGQGTFGQVVKCQNMKTHEIVAVKVVKNKPAYFNQSMMEVTILDMLNKNFDPNDEHHILRMRDSFIHRNHLCLVFELLSSNLYELIKQNQFQGLSTQLVKVFMAQLLDAMTILKEAKLIHCDLKPENILLRSLQSPQIKVIDFGSACHEQQTVYTYIQSRFYRSPEVLLGMPYSAAIDMWSLGCIAVELFLGLPLFPGTSEYNQITRIVEMLGLPPLSMLKTGKQTHQFFDTHEWYNPHTNQTEKRYRLKSIEQYSREHGTNEQPGKQYFKAKNLPDIINSAPIPNSKSRQGAELEKELNNRAAFIDFCQGLLNMNPLTRWTPQQARLHPFITGEKFTKPFQPDGMIPQAPPPSTDPKRPYGGLVPSQPKGVRAYQDAATYNQHLNQHQMYTAHQASQANAPVRNNPYLANQPNQSQPPHPPAPASYSSMPDAYASQSHQQLSPYSSNAPSNTAQRNQYLHYNNYNTASSQLNPNSAASGSHYSSSRNRSNTVNQMDVAVPPALARLQHMNKDVIAGRNALTPVMNRDDAIQEWERRQAGKPPAAQPYPQLELLQQQAEMAAAQGLTSWAQTGHGAHRYQAQQPSKLSHSFHPPPPNIVVDDDRRDTIMSNVRSAARGDATTYAGSTGYSGGGSGNSSSTRYQNAYAQPPPPQQAPGSGAFDPSRNGPNVYVPMQPEQYQAYSNSSSSRVVQQQQQQQQPPQGGAPSFYGAHVVQDGQGAAQRALDGSARRNSGIDMWQQ